MRLLYQNLNQIPEPGSALAATKAHYLDQQSATSSRTWAAFQIFVD
jgi:hypothetical protein